MIHTHEASLPIIFTPISSPCSNMPIATVHLPTEDSPTKASVRAVTRDTMLNTISDRVRQSHEQHQGPVRDEAEQHKQGASSSHQEYQVPQNGGSFSLGKPTRQMPYPRYDIQRLVELGKNVQVSSEVLLKVKPDAIAENLFQYMGIDRSLRPLARSRGLSDISNLSRASIVSSNGMSEWLPSRQPRPAPQASDLHQTSRLQQHEGFVRFLKQHASPPHQRVTAGGRIVPTGPLSPPPMFDYASLNGLVQGQQAKTYVPNRESTSSSFNYRVKTLPTSSQPTVSSIVMAPETSQPLGSQMMSFGMAQEPVWNGDSVYAQQPFPSSMAQLPPSQFAMIPLGLLPDGTALVSCSGVCYRSYWNGVTTIMEPVTTGHPVPMANSVATAYPPKPLDHSFYDIGPCGTMPSPMSSQNAPLAPIDTSAVPFPHQSKPTDSADSGSSLSEEKLLKSQLTNLDKHLALHHYEIGPAERIQLVAQRKTLVQAVAKLRNDREPVKQTIPIVVPSDVGSRDSSTRLGMTSLPKLPPQPSGEITSRSANFNDSKLLKKLLSPSAPAFVPGGALIPSAGTLKLGSVPEKKAAITLTRPSTTKEKPSIDGIDEILASNKLLQEASSGAHSQPYVEVDPWDPAMRIIPPSMIWYARKYSAESTDNNKKFCTTIEEFQEAIRRVREQARMWGCVGGNSKDPAYDAEEDIWYAIKDEYPIPRPSKVPDHIICPRPWNWYDSAFNVKATIEPRINMRGDTFEDVYPQPKKEATSTKYSFADIILSTHKQTETATDARKPRLVGSAFPTDKVPLGTPTRDILLDRQQNKQQMFGIPSTATGKKVPGIFKTLEALSTENQVCPPSFAESGTAAKQEAMDSLPSHAGGHAPYLPSTLRAAKRPNGHVEESRQALHQSRTPPSPIAISAAQAAYGSKDSVSHRLARSQVEPFAERPLTTRNQLRTNTLDESHFLLGNRKPDNLTRNQTNDVSTVDTLHQRNRPISASPNTMYQYHEAAIQGARLNAVQLTRCAHFNETSDTRPHRENYTCSRCGQSVLADSIALPTRARDYGLLNEANNVLSAESRGVWGPEQLCTTVNEDNLPKVKIPGPVSDYEATYNRTHCKRHHEYAHITKFARNVKVPSAHELKIESVEGPPGISHDTFLKDMLRDPRYSFTVQGDDDGPMESLVAYKMAHNEREMKLHGETAAHEPYDLSGRATSAHRDLKNEIGTGVMVDSHVPAAKGRGFQFFPKNPRPPTFATNKANSSLASSTYHAQGHLPHYDGAGKARAASIYRQQPNPTPYKQARVNLPLCSSYTQREHSNERPDQRSSIDRASYNIDTRYVSATFGYDGSGDPPPETDTTSGKGKAKEQERSFDYKGVTTASFDQHRPEHDNEQHRGAVKAFFQELHEKEIRYMMARQRRNTKTVP